MSQHKQSSSPHEKTAHFFVSVVVLAGENNTSKDIASFVEEVHDTLEAHYAHFEMVVILPSCAGETLKALTPTLEKREGLRVLRLAGITPEWTAEFAGLENVLGDTVLITPRMAATPKVIHTAIEQARNENTALFGTYENRRHQSVLWRMGAAVLYWYMRKCLHLDMPDNTTGLKVFHRKDLNVLLKVRERSRRSILLSAYSGLAWQPFHYDLPEHQQSVLRKSMIRRIGDTLEVIFTNSLQPLRVAALLSLIASVLNLGYIGYIFAIYILKENVAEGWITLSLQSSGLFFLLFLVLAILAEYVGRILQETQSRPPYFIAEEKTSNILYDAEKRRNIFRTPQ